MNGREARGQSAAGGSVERNDFVAGAGGERGEDGSPRGG